MLICGAISCPLEAAVAAVGIEVIAQTCGDVEEVLEAFVRGALTQDGGAFLMPGCCGRRSRSGSRVGRRCRRNRWKGAGGAEVG